jgi:hypothetical protein
LVFFCKKGYFSSTGENKFMRVMPEQILPGPMLSLVVAKPAYVGVDDAIAQVGGFKIYLTQVYPCQNAATSLL